MSGPEVCERCGYLLPQPKDYMLRRNGSKARLKFCWANVANPSAWLTPDEEAADATTLKKLLVAERQRARGLLCMVLAEGRD